MTSQPSMTTSPAPRVQRLRRVRSAVATLLLAEALVAFCALGFETATARLVAPHAGMSTDTWTAIIAGFLLSWALGNHVGGLWARPSTRSSLALAAASLLLGALAVAATPFILPWLDAMLIAPDPLARWRVAAFAGLPTLLPGFLFGIAPPLVMLAIIARSAGSGRAIGLANAAGAIGSAAGAVGMVWFVLDELGTRGACLAVAGVALATALLILICAAASPSGGRA